MSDGDRGGINKIGLIAAIIVAGIFGACLLGWGFYYQSYYQQTASDNAAQYAKNADDRIRQACIPMPAQAENECTIQARQTERQGQRDEYDLYSQRIMALWTMVMGAAAVVGVGLSTIGVYLIWQTFRETQATGNLISAQNKTAKESVRTQNRAYVYATSARIWKGSIQLKLANGGPTPARSIIIETTKLVWGNLKIEDRTIVVSMAKRCPSVVKGDSDWLNIDPGEDAARTAHIKNSLQRAESEKVKVDITGNILSETIFGERAAFPFHFYTNRAGINEGGKLLIARTDSDFEIGPASEDEQPPQERA